MFRVESAILIEVFLPSRPAMGAQFLYTRSIARVNPYAPSFKGSPEVGWVRSVKWRPVQKREATLNYGRAVEAVAGAGDSGGWATRVIASVRTFSMSSGSKPSTR
jgi:hypothetical protein